MNFFGYELNDPYPPPALNSDFYTENLKPKNSKANPKLTILLSTSNSPNYFISLIHASALISTFEELEETISFITQDLLDKNFNLTQIDILGQRKITFEKSVYSGELCYDITNQLSSKSLYFLFFVIKNNDLYKPIY